jgi:Dyp-type peroxidase family
VQQGARRRNAQNQSVEPFGYTDGISQPVFFQDEMPSGQPNGAYDPSAPLSLVLIHDPNGAGPYSCGSFLVYRKLRQDVAGFNKNVAALAEQLGITPELAGAYAFGRFKDGTPVVLADKPTGHSTPDNSFQFALDPNGGRCPFQAHIRKTNPRGDTVRTNGAPLQVERSHRIVRRAFPFGAEGGDDVGLQFFCYQSDIGNQFEFMQSAWSNMTHFLRMHTGLDCIIGQAALASGVGGSPPSGSGGQPWPKTWDDPAQGTATFDFGCWVSLQGGAYLFAPSISFLRNLAG